MNTASGFVDTVTGLRFTPTGPGDAMDVAKDNGGSWFKGCRDVNDGNGCMGPSSAIGANGCSGARVPRGANGWILPNIPNPEASNSGIATLTDTAGTVPVLVPDSLDEEPEILLILEVVLDVVPLLNSLDPSSSGFQDVAIALGT